MSKGTYEEELPCGGKLVVTKTSWKIAYYFRGPDLRYNGTFVNIDSSKVGQYITAFETNFNEYSKLKANIPQGGEFTIKGLCDMNINIGEYFEGVCITSYHMPIANKKMLEKVISGYKYAQARAPQIRSFLESL